MAEPVTRTSGQGLGLCKVPIPGIDRGRRFSNQINQPLY
jgi:hypothetical protein